MRKIINMKEIETISKNYHLPEFLCHVQFVRKTALELQNKYGGNKEIIEIASLLHDIGRDNEREGEDHAEAGARLAEKELKQFNLSNNLINNIKNCIASHNCKKRKPKTMEEKIIATADAGSFIEYPTAFIILSVKPPKKKAKWFLGMIRKNFNRILFPDYKKEIGPKYKELCNILNQIIEC